jgi:D-aspartate ligase
MFDTGLAAVRGLGRAGVPVIGIDADPRMPGFKSRYCVAKRGPDPVQNPEELSRFLLGEAKKLERRGILFPASDAYVLFVSRYRQELHECFDFILPPAEVIEAILNKRSQYDMAQRAGIPYPQTFYPQTPEDLTRIQDQVSYPAFIKPYYAHLWRTTFQNKGFRVDSEAELHRRFATIWPTGLQAMVQSVIPGPASNNFEISFYIASSGEAPAFFTVRKLRQYPPEFGVGTMVETVQRPEMKTLALRLLEGLDYRGFGNLEFKLDPHDDQLKLIELNARLWQQNDQAAACGINFPLMQYLDLTGQPLPAQPEVAAGVKWVDPLSDFQSFWQSYRQGELSPRAWIKSWRGVRSFAYVAKDDLLPAAVVLQYGMKLVNLPLYLIKHRLNHEE